MPGHTSDPFIIPCLPRKRGGARGTPGRTSDPWLCTLSHTITQKTRSPRDARAYIWPLSCSHCPMPATQNAYEWVSAWVVRVSECVSKWEWVSEWVSVSVWVWVSEREWVNVSEWVCECEWVWVSAYECVCECVSVWVSVSEYEWASECEWGDGRRRRKADTELKTKTPDVNIGKNIKYSYLCILRVRTISPFTYNRIPRQHQTYNLHRRVSIILFNFYI